MKNKFNVLASLSAILVSTLAFSATVQTTIKDYTGLSQLWHVYALTSTGTKIAIETYTYNSSGQVATETDVNGKVTTYAYDIRGRLQTVIDNSNNLNGAGSATTSYTYDQFDQPKTVTDPLGQVTTYQYDALGRLWQLYSPDTGHTSWGGYDAAGNPLRWTDARGNSIRVYYDALNRPIKRTVDIGTKLNQLPVVYTWDTAKYGKGQLASVSSTDQAGNVTTTTFTYLPTGKLGSQSDTYAGLSRTVTYTRDSANRPFQTLYPSGTGIAFQYNTHGQVKTLWHGNTVLANNITWEPFGPIASIPWANGLTWADTYDENGRIASKGLGDGNRVYSWNNDGSLKTITDPNPNLSQTLAVDTFGRLNSWSQNGASRTWVYDLDDNRTKQTVGSVTEVDAYLHYPQGQQYSGNRLVSKTGSSPATYTYDGIGDTTGDGTLTYAYDGYGRLYTAAVGTSVKATFIYNGLGQRIAKIAGTTTYRYAYDGAGHIVGEYGNAGALLEETAWIGDRPIDTWRLENAVFKDFPVATDHLNTPRELIDWTSKKVVWRWDSEPYGVGLPTTAPDSNGLTVTYNLRFPGQVYDAETGLHYNYHRDYNPATGRYEESDPIGLKGGINTYAYSNAKPTVFSDKGGLSPYSGNYSPGGTYLPGIGDVFQPGTPANDAFVRSTNAMLNAAGDAVTDAVNKIEDICKTRDCGPITAEIAAKKDVVIGRYYALLADKYNLYANPITKQSTRRGSWVGHQQQFQDAQANLRKSIAVAQGQGCPVDPDAIVWASTPTPTQPVE